MLSMGFVQVQHQVDLKALNKRQALHEAKQSRAWSNGKIVLQDSTELIRRVKYNFLKNYASIAIADERATFSEKDILYMEF
jgi:hypothetical protein